MPVVKSLVFHAFWFKIVLVKSYVFSKELSKCYEKIVTINFLHDIMIDGPNDLSHSFALIILKQNISLETFCKEIIV